MKKTLFSLGGLLASTLLVAQSVPDATQLIYHERYQSAKAVLHKVLQADPNNAEAWYRLSQAYLPLKETQQLADSLQLATPAIKNNAWYKVAYGQLLLANNHADSARWYFEQAIGDDRKKDPAILLAVANAQISEKNGDPHAALLVLNQAGKKDINAPAFHVLRGNAYRRLANGTEAYRSYQAALNEDSKNAAALYQMGKIFVAQKNADTYLDYFNKAIAADPLYAPAWYELYYHYYFTDAQKALDHFRQYLLISDYNAENEYQHIDLVYINKKYDSAIAMAQHTLAALPADSMPRLHKLLAYSYLGLKDTARAFHSMTTYFAHANDSNFVVKDYEVMAGLYHAMPGKEDSALIFYQAAVTKITDSAALFTYYKKLSDLYKDKKDNVNQAIWLGKYYTNNDRATNIDLFNWGIAHFKAEQYAQADTVFGQYIAKYPEQSFGYYWRARANSLKDSAMEKGIAIPHYQALIDVLQKDTTKAASATDKKWLIEAYGYIAAYETNEAKDYKEAIAHLQKILEIDPANKDAQQYIAILEKKVAADNRSATATSTDTNNSSNNNANNK
ncbi:tetratricopeptide repeat protein [Pseudoflavitalea sp. X16]|uniref:tetratricopeptide repeat protein n=1 Tax=Paraflavitalea devenefica TaxID=2716334 RepID=UPI0014227099|nr:tetratricopeptide repeat protein [Paraflavitalea devenefica]NII28572.1 tetratricopeptide repeat protein [Paraflavitalea devenefica]